MRFSRSGDASQSRPRDSRFELRVPHCRAMQVQFSAMMLSCPTADGRPVLSVPVPARTLPAKIPALPPIARSYFPFPSGHPVGDVPGLTTQLAGRLFQFSPPGRNSQETADVVTAGRRVVTVMPRRLRLRSALSSATPLRRREGRLRLRACLRLGMAIVAAHVMLHAFLQEAAWAGRREAEQAQQTTERAREQAQQDAERSRQSTERSQNDDSQQVAPKLAARPRLGPGPEREQG